MDKSVVSVMPSQMSTDKTVVFLKRDKRSSRLVFVSTCNVVWSIANIHIVRERWPWISLNRSVSRSHDWHLKCLSLSKTMQNCSNPAYKMKNRLQYSACLVECIPGAPSQSKAITDWQRAMWQHSDTRYVDHSPARCCKNDKQSQWENLKQQISQKMMLLLQHSDFLVMWCRSNIIFCDICCDSSASRPYKAL